MIVSASVTMDLVIFNNTAPVAGDGITMTNSAGQVTFSTVKRPFVFDQQLTMTDSNQYVGDKYCQNSIYRCAVKESRWIL